MAFYYILLGHLIGDFVLQTNRIAVNKPLHRRWNILHAVIVTLCMLVFAIPFGFFTALFTLCAGALHLLIDKAKVVFAEKYQIHDLLAFIIDQVLHIAIIALISVFASSDPTLFFLDKQIVMIVLILSFVTFFAAIFNQYILLGIIPRNDNSFFRRGEKLAGICARFLITLSIFLAISYNFLFLLIVAAVPAILVLQAKPSIKDSVGVRELLIKLLLDWNFSAAGAGLLLAIL